MFDKEKLERIRESYERWEETTLQQRLAQHPERKQKFTTVSGEEMERLYTPLDIAAARDNGARSIAVATGFFTADQLTSAGADVVFPDFSSWQTVLDALLA